MSFANVAFATYGPKQITDLGVLNSLTNAIKNSSSVLVDSDNLNPNFDPAPETLKWAVVYYHKNQGDDLKSVAAHDGQTLNFGS